VPHSSSISIVGPKGGLTVRLHRRGEQPFSIHVTEGSELRVVGESPWSGELDVEHESPSEADVHAWGGAELRWFVDGQERTTPEDPGSGPKLASARAGDPFPIFVRDLSAHDGRIEITFSDDVDAAALRAIGGRPRSGGFWIFTSEDRSIWTFPGGDDSRAMAVVLNALRDIGLPFLGAGPGWHPGAIFEDLRDHGLATGPYRKVEWYGPGEWVVREG
jgi:hypothetical protein